MERWETLQAKAVERQRQSTQLRHLQRQVKTLRLSMDRVLSRCATFSHPHTLDDPSQIGQRVKELQVSVRPSPRRESHWPWFGCHVEL